MRGDINEVEFILESPEADINLTWVSFKLFNLNSLITVTLNNPNI